MEKSIQTSMNDNIKYVKGLLTEMKDFTSSPRYAADRLHQQIVHDDIHIPISKHIRKLGFFASKPEYTKGMAEYNISGNYRGNEVLTNQLGIGKSLVPIPQHHPTQEHSIRHLVDRAFSKKPSKYLNYLKAVHDSVDSAIQKHRAAWEISHTNANDAIAAIKASTMNQFRGATPIGSNIEDQQRMAHHHSEMAAEHEKHIRSLTQHKQTIVNHARGLGSVYDVDLSEPEQGNLNSHKLVSGVWDEVF
jgi:hypothetical protein